MLSRVRNSRGRPITAPASFIHPCRPTVAKQPPTGPGWAHELKHDGYRLQIHVRNGRVRLFTMNGADWSKRYPRIVEEAARIKAARSWMPRLSHRKRKLALSKLLLRSHGGIQYVEHTEGHGEKLFEAVYDLGLEGIVSKRLTSVYRSGPPRAWLKIKNPTALAATRALDGTF